MAWGDRITGSNIAVISVCLVCIVLACIFLATYPVNNDLLYVGIAFGALGLVIGTVYVVHKCLSGKVEKSGCFKRYCCCWICCDEGCGSCCDACVRTALCLRRPRGSSATRRPSRTSRDRRRELVSLRLQQQRVISSAQGAGIDTQAQFHNLEQEIQGLYAKYTRIEPLAMDRHYIRQGRNLLQEDQVLLSQWMEGLRVPTWEDIQKMKSRRSTVDARFEEEDSRQQELSRNGRPTAFSIAYSNVAMLDAFETDDIFLNSLVDDLPPISGNSTNVLQPPPYQATDPNASVSASDVMRTYFTASNDFRLPAYLAGSQDSLAPPLDDTDAPPSYEDATSTPV